MNRHISTCARKGDCGGTPDPCARARDDRALTGQVDLDTFEPSTLEGIELYLGSTGAPPRYSWSRDLSNCGTILLWTRGSDMDVPHQTINSATEIEEMVASLSVFTADQVYENFDRYVKLFQEIFGKG